MTTILARDHILRMLENPNNERHNKFHAEEVPGCGWDRTGFDVVPEIQAQELLYHMRKVLQ
jgi:hypothetical protein